MQQIVTGEFPRDCDAGYPASADDRLVDMFVALATTGMSGLLASQEAAGLLYKQIEQEIPGAVTTPNRKNAALYVDVTLQGDVLTPSRATEWAMAEVLGLEWHLETYRLLPEVLRDDERWKNFSGRVRGWLGC